MEAEGIGDGRFGSYDGADPYDDFRFCSDEDEPEAAPGALATALSAATLAGGGKGRGGRRRHGQPLIPRPAARADADDAASEAATTEAPAASSGAPVAARSPLEATVSEQLTARARATLVQRGLTPDAAGWAESAIADALAGGWRDPALGDVFI